MCPGINIDELPVVNAMSSSTDSPIDLQTLFYVKVDIIISDYDSVSYVGLDSATNLNGTSGSSVATLLNKGM